MDEIENQLLSRLANDPADWESRLALAEKYFSRGAHDGIAELFRQAPNPPWAQEYAHKAVELTAGGDLSGLDAVLKSFAAANYEDAWAHHVYARILAHQHQLEEARREYDLALSIDSSKKDEGLEALLGHPDTPGEEKLQPDPETPPVEFVGKTFMVALGKATRAQEKEPDDREKISALITAVVIHIVMLIVFYFIVISAAPINPPQITATSVHSLDEDSLSRERARKVKSEVLATSRTNVLSASALSSITAPAMDVNVESTDLVGMGNFGRSASFGKVKGGGGTVSFFGSDVRAKRVVFVVDFSASMLGDKEELMRRELSKSVKALPSSVEFALIFFSGPAWYAGQKVGRAQVLDKFVANVVTERDKRYVWYEGWDEKGRHSGSGKTALYHFAEGPERLPPGRYMKASDTNIKNSLVIIEQTPLVFGTDWRWPLMMAMNMQPNAIYFMTDGAFGVGDGVTREEMVEGLLAYNRRHSNSKINTICMKVLTARGELEQLAKGSGGEFTLVQADGTVVRGDELE